MTDQKLKICHHFLIALFVLSGVYITVRHLINGDYPLAVLGPVSLLFLLIPRAGERLLRMKLDLRLRIWIIAFSLLGFSLGTGLRWCDNVPHYDKFLHLLSGIMFTVIGLCLYARVSREPGLAAGSRKDNSVAFDRRKKRLLQISYAFFFSQFVAVIWEIGEFLGFILTGHDSQHHLTTGVFDTMGDLIACFLGSLLAALDYWFYSCKNRKTLLMGIVESFDKQN